MHAAPEALASSASAAAAGHRDGTAGGTRGLYLLPYVEDARRLLVFDAVDYGDAPGTLRIVVGDGAALHGRQR